MSAPKVEQKVYRQADRDALLSEKVYRQADRDALLSDESGKCFKKKARIVAVQQDKAFIVYTDRGPMQGQAGDWLVTNHPDDDPGSDLWTISAERMANTYIEDHGF